MSTMGTNVTSTDPKDEPEYELREAEEKAGLRPKRSDLVKDATTLVEQGFPVNTEDGQVMATKKAVKLDADGEEIPATSLPHLQETAVVVESENGTLEVSEDPHILQAEGTTEANAKKAASESKPKTTSAKSES